MSKMIRSHNKNQNIPSEPEEMFSALRLFDGVSKREKRVLLSSVKKTINQKICGLCLMASYT